MAPLVDPFDTEEALEDRARSWLHANCAGCHQPGGEDNTPIDLRWSTPLAEARLCDALPEASDLDIADARIIAPGDPSRSLLLERVSRSGAGQMPPLGRVQPDPEAVALLEAWILSLEECP